MSFLLDTNIVSEWVRDRPDPGVVAWLSEINEDEVFLSVVTFAELRHGIVRMPSGRRKERLRRWLAEDLPDRFEDRVLAIDRDVVRAWGEVVAARQASGKPIGAMDAFIAATACVHGLELVTRNTGDFEGSVRAMLNPWRRP